MESVTSTGSIGAVVAWNNQHKPEDYAGITAEQLLPMDNDKGITPLAILDMREKVADYLEHYFVKLIELRQAELDVEPMTLRIPEELVVDGAKSAARRIKSLSNGTFWADTTNALGWMEVAINVIATMLSTALHVENLLHCDSHPDMPQGQAYKQRYQGII